MISLLLTIVFWALVACFIIAILCIIFTALIGVLTTTLPIWVIIIVAILVLVSFSPRKKEKDENKKK